MIRLLFILLFSSSIFSQTIKQTFKIPEGYERKTIDVYHDWIVTRSIKLNVKAKTYDGYEVHGLNKKYVAVFNYDIGTRDLHQCADAVIYNNARYKFDYNKFKEIKYTFTDGQTYGYEDFLKGIYVIQKGNSVTWGIRKKIKASLSSFKKYITVIWAYAGTWSLEAFDTVSVDIKNIKPGDVFVVGGFPGHAVSVVDVVVNKNGDKKFMLSQSYMPAQEQHILINPINDSVWFEYTGNTIKTPDMWFRINSLKRFKK
tara:strand:- start:14402 stop:15172 length:771 start_codon:yes stop_codon:yes gene_type:complete